MTQPELEIVWDGGSLDLLGENDTSYGPVTIQAVAEGTEWGNPQSVRRALFSALADGSASVKERDDNRTVTVKLRLTAADSAALAGGEAPLHMLSGVRGAELRWTPPNDFAAPAAYIVVASDLTHQMDDLAENRVQRFYTLTLACLPAALSIDPVVIEALPPFVAAPVVLDDCTSTTGWGGPDASFAVVSGAVEATLPAGYGVDREISLTKTLARAKRYLAVEFENVWGVLASSIEVDTTVGGSQTPVLVGSSGTWRFYDLPTALGSVTAMRFTVRTYATAAGVGVRILTIAESETPAVSAGRQSLRAIPTSGSARAAGSLCVAAPTASDDGLVGAPLGHVIVYSGPQYDPRLSVGRNNSVVADAVALSGQVSTVTDASFAFTRPATAFVNGSHSIWVHAKGTHEQVVNWTVTVRAIGTPSAYAGLSDTLAVVATLTASTTFSGTSYNLLNLGVMDLPGLDLGEASMLHLRFEFAVNGTVNLDEALAFNRSLGSLTIVNTSGMTALWETGPDEWEKTVGPTRLWIDAASLASNARVLAGRPAERALAMPISLASALRSWDGAHLFIPDATFLYVGTTGTLDPVVTGEFRPAWHTHPAV